jgi:hypothetical protein
MEMSKAGTYSVSVFVGEALRKELEGKSNPFSVKY